MPDTDMPTRPDYACMVHPGPQRGRVWTPADQGYRTCSACLDRIRDQLREIPARYRILNAALGSSGDHGGRGAPGFGSRAPASDHIIAMRDPRSDRTATCWRGSDKRFHQETETPVLSVFTELDHIAWHIVDTRNLDGGPEQPTVDATARFIDNHLDWLTRQDDIADHAAVIAELTAQLRPATGEPGRRHIGHCPNTIADGEEPRECGAKLYAPLGGGTDTIRCRNCDREWPRSEWLRLGMMLDAS